MQIHELAQERCGKWKSRDGETLIVAELVEMEPLHYGVKVSQYDLGKHSHTIRESCEDYLTRNDYLRDAGFRRVN